MVESHDVNGIIFSRTMLNALCHRVAKDLRAQRSSTLILSKAHEMEGSAPMSVYR